jgi:hypothetical protein
MVAKMAAFYWRGGSEPGFAVLGGLELFDVELLRRPARDTFSMFPHPPRRP